MRQKPLNALWWCFLPFQQRSAEGGKKLDQPVYPVQQVGQVRDVPSPQIPKRRLHNDS